MDSYTRVHRYLARRAEINPNTRLVDYFGDATLSVADLHLVMAEVRHLRARVAEMGDADTPGAWKAPEPPEGVTSVRDLHGRRWTVRADGMWECPSSIYVRTWATLLAFVGELTDATERDGA